MKKRLIILVILLFVLAGCVAGCSALQPTNSYKIEVVCPQGEGKSFRKEIPEVMEAVHASML